MAKTFFGRFVRGRKNDLTHHYNVFASTKNDLATKNVARSFLNVARSFPNVARTLFLWFVHMFG